MKTSIHSSWVKSLLLSAQAMPKQGYPGGLCMPDFGHPRKGKALEKEPMNRSTGEKEL